MHLSRAGSKVTIYAPDVDQMHTIDHTKGAPMEPNRWVGHSLGFKTLRG